MSCQRQRRRLAFKQLRRGSQVWQAYRGLASSIAPLNLAPMAAVVTTLDHCNAQHQCVQIHKEKALLCCECTFSSIADCETWNKLTDYMTLHSDISE